MIVDSSAVVAVLRDEPTAAAIRVALRDAPTTRMSAATLLEVSIVAGQGRWEDVDYFVERTGCEVVSFTEEQAALARDAYARFGKGSGSKARLNFGDCFSYALAKSVGEALLFTGDDFTHTDVDPALD